MSKLSHSNDKTMHEIESRRRMTDLDANYFAMCLLMPEDLLRKEVSKMGKNADIFEDDWIKSLANKFKVDEKLMLIRLGQLGFMVAP